MYPRHHILATAAAVVPLRAAGLSWRTLCLFGAASVLIDVDHYLSYVWRTGDLSLHNAYCYHISRVNRDDVRFALNLHVPRIFPGPNRPFHALSVIGTMLFLAVFLPSLRPLAAGVVFHRTQDYVWEASRVGPTHDD